MLSHLVYQENQLTRKNLRDTVHLADTYRLPFRALKYFLTVSTSLGVNSLRLQIKDPHNLTVPDMRLAS